MGQIKKILKCEDCNGTGLQHDFVISPIGKLIMRSYMDETEAKSKLRELNASLKDFTHKEKNK